MITSHLPVWMHTMFARVALALGALFTLGACGATVDEIRTIRVNVPVAVSCVPATLGEAPLYPDTVEALRAAEDAAERYLLVFAGRSLREARLNELEPVVAGCRQ